MIELRADWTGSARALRVTLKRDVQGANNALRRELDARPPELGLESALDQKRAKSFMLRRFDGRAARLVPIKSDPI